MSARRYSRTEKSWIYVIPLRVIDTNDTDFGITYQDIRIPYESNMPWATLGYWIKELTVFSFPTHLMRSCHRTTFHLGLTYCIGLSSTTSDATDPSTSVMLN